jgi:crotonobetainyl-CoA:carnitine CoA-transferase CaiB-like acyl-CoA transferase
LRLDEALIHPQFVARQVATEIGDITQFTPPFKLSAWPWTARRPAVAAGSDSDEVLRAAGYAEAEIEALRRDRVI